jgi:hypothetical protein
MKKNSQRVLFNVIKDIAEGKYYFADTEFF